MKILSPAAAPDIINKGKLPSLSENAFLRYLTFSALYIAQGIPEGLTYYAIPAWMAMNGKTPAEIGGFVAIIAIPWSFKLLVAPLMDRFTFLEMGRRRPWVLFGQFGLIVSFISMGFIHDPLNHLFLLKIAGFMVSFFGAFQDVAVDGMAIDIVPGDQQARANGIMWGSKTIGISASVATGSWIINAYGFFYAVSFLSAVVVFIMVIPILLRERPGERLLPWTKGVASIATKNIQLDNWKIIFKSLFSVFLLPSSILMGIAAFFICVAFSLMNTLLPVFTIQQLGWTQTGYSNVLATANIIGGLIGMFAGGAIVDFFGKKRMMNLYAIILIVLVSSLAFLKIGWSNSSFITGFILIYYSLYTLFNIALFASAMHLCWKRVSATQFTIYMAIANMGLATGASFLGPLKANFDWEYVIISFVIFAVIMIFFLQFVNFKPHLKHIEELELNFIEKV